MDICLDVKKKKSKHLCPETYKLFFEPKRFLEEVRGTYRQKKDLQSSKDYMLAGLIFENIKDYEFQHSTPQIIDAIIEGTR